MSKIAEKETAPSPSVGADGEQSLAKDCNHSIPESNDEFNDMLQLLNLAQQRNDPDYISADTLSQILDQSISPKKSVIDGFLHAGTYLFAGAPKIGKSFLAAQICYHVSLGIPLWGMPTRQGTALYLALEDDTGRLQTRFSTMYGVEGSDTLYISTKSKELGDGLEGQIRYFCRKHPETCLVVADTLQKIRGLEKMSYASDYEAVARLKALSDDLDICIIIVHHTRKQGADDQFDTISGTNGLLGAADGGMVMHKENRTTDRATLSVVGRDQPELNLTMKRAPLTQIWESCTELTPADINPPHWILPIVADFVDSCGGNWCGSAYELLSLLPDIEMPLNLLTRQLNVGGSWLYRHRGLHYKNIHTRLGSQLTLTNTPPQK